MRADKIVDEIDKLEDKLQLEVQTFSQKMGSGKLDFFYLSKGTFLVRSAKDAGLQRINADNLKRLANWIINITGEE